MLPLLHTERVAAERRWGAGAAPCERLMQPDCGVGQLQWAPLQAPIACLSDW